MNHKKKLKVRNLWTDLHKIPEGPHNSTQEHVTRHYIDLCKMKKTAFLGLPVATINIYTHFQRYTSDRTMFGRQIYPNIYNRYFLNIYFAL